MEILFASTNSTCAAVSQTNQFDFIGLLGTILDPQIEDNVSEGIPRPSGNGLDPVVATTIGADDEATNTGAVQDTDTAGIQHTFTSTVNCIVVGGATLVNGAFDAVFATKAFTGEDLTLNNQDTLEITWQIQLGS